MSDSNPIARAVFFLIALALGSASVWFETVRRNVYFDRRSAMSGVQEEIGWYYDLNPDCSVRGMPNIMIGKSPAHGEVRVEKGTDFPAYPLNSPWSRCNTSKVPSTLVYYTSNPGYVGPEKFELVVVFPDGKTWKLYENVSVLAAAQKVL